MLFNILFLHLLALMTPGPDFFYIVSAALNSPKNQQLKAVLGITAGVIFWSLISSLGLNIIIQKFTWFIPALSVLGGVYLIYLSIQISNSRKDKVKNKTGLKISFLGGLITNITNPKAIIYFSSIFSIYASENKGNSNIIVLVLIWVLSFFWFFFLSIIFSREKNIRLYNKNKKHIDISISICFFVLACLLIINQIKIII